MSYSTINNCNININNNIILSNNYIYNNKYLCYHNSQKLINIPSNNSRNKSISKSKDKKNKKFNIEQNKSKQHKIPLTSRNIRINLDNFRTEYNFLNSKIRMIEMKIIYNILLLENLIIKKSIIIKIDMYSKRKK